jgi:hypothetical protein
VIVPMARMSPQEIRVCLAISIEAEASNDRSPLAILGQSYARIDETVTRGRSL